MTEIDNCLRLTIAWDQQSTEINNRLRSIIDWDQQLTEINNWLRSIIDWDQQSTDINNWLWVTTGLLLTDGRLTDGRLTDGLLTDGQLTDRWLTDGQMTERWQTDRWLTDRRVTNDWLMTWDWHTLFSDLIDLLILFDYLLSYNFREKMTYYLEWNMIQISSSLVWTLSRENIRFSLDLAKSVKRNPEVLTWVRSIWYSQAAI